MSISSICLIRTANISCLEHFLCFLQNTDDTWPIPSPLPPLAKYWMYVKQNSLHSSKRFCLNYLKLVCCGFADSGWDLSSWFGMLQWWLCWGVRIFPKLFQINRRPGTLNISPFLWRTSSFLVVVYRLQSLGCCTEQS